MQQQQPTRKKPRRHRKTNKRAAAASIPQQKCIIVIARYSENLEWIRTPPFNKYRLIIYNKGLDDNFAKTDNVLEVIKLPNVGRESHTYIWHIINTHAKYSPQITVFLPGSVTAKFKMGDAQTMMRLLQQNNYTRAVLVGFLHTVAEMEKQFERVETTYTSNNRENAANNVTSNVLQSKWRPYGEWLKHMKLRATNFITLYGTTSVHRNTLAQYSAAYWRSLLRQLQPSSAKPTQKTLAEYSNPETGFFFERSWATILYSPKNLLYDWKLKREIENTDPNLIFENTDKILGKIPTEIK